jgi:hypothetical protein
VVLLQVERVARARARAERLWVTGRDVGDHSATLPHHRPRAPAARRRGSRASRRRTAAAHRRRRYRRPRRQVEAAEEPVDEEVEQRAGARRVSERAARPRPRSGSAANASCRAQPVRSRRRSRAEHAGRRSRRSGRCGKEFANATRTCWRSRPPCGSPIRAAFHVCRAPCAPAPSRRLSVDGRAAAPADDPRRQRRSPAGLTIAGPTSPRRSTPVRRPAD